MVFVLLVFSLLFAASCTPGEVTGEGALATPVFELDAELRRVAAHVPSFGGVYGEGDQVIAYVLDPNERGLEARLRAALIEVYGADLFTAPVAVAPDAEDVAFDRARAEARAAPPRALTLRTADFTVGELSAGHRRLLGVLSLPEVVFVDLDERVNRLRVGVLTESARRAAIGYAARAGIDPGALIVELTAPIRQLASLRDRFRPIPGGVHIERRWFKYCTLGFNARRGSQAGFVTNSHCTRTEVGYDGSEFWQARSFGGGSRVGREVFDPPPFFGHPCRDNALGCRWSDAAFVAYDQRTTSGGAYVARPTHANGSREVVGSASRFRVVGKKTAFCVNDVLNKVGRTTGWTWGRVSDTCRSGQFEDTGVKIWCQHHVSRQNARLVDSGDSGSPVFNRLSGSTVELAGLLWGSSVNNDDTFFFSPIQFVEFELGVESVDNVSAIPPRPTCSNPDDHCCRIDSNNRCVCAASRAQCSSDPTPPCPSGQVCCFPGNTASTCGYCARSWSACPAPR